MRKRAGFTLLEVLLAMTALTLIMTMAYAAFHLAIRAVEKGANAVVAAQRLRTSRDIVIRQLKSISMQPVQTKDGESVFCLRGTATALTFITEVGQLGGGGLVRVVYRVMDDPARLEMMETPDIERCELDDAPSIGQAETIMDGFTSLRFEYLNEDGEWVDRWDSFGEGITSETSGLPLGVRVQLDGLIGADLDVATQELPIPVMAFAYDTSLADDADTYIDKYRPQDEQALAKQAEDKEDGDDEDPDDGNDGDDDGDNEGEDSE